MNLMPWKEYFDTENYLCPKEKEGEKENKIGYIFS